MSAECITLNSGYKIPLVGLGTCQSTSPDDSTASVRSALDAGYRHFDTATAYMNEELIGEVLQEYLSAGKLKREDVFITTKLWMTYHEEDRVPLCLDQSLKKLQLDYVDLYLIHMPTAFRETGKGDFFPVDENNKLAFKHVKVEETWKGMEQCVKSGKAKSIGVSNFSMTQIDRIINVAEIKPCTNQVECHLYLQRPKLFKFLKEREITLTAYSPLGSPGRPGIFKMDEDPVVLDDPVTKELASKYKKSPSQILLRFLVQRGVVVIPKSRNPKRIQEIIQIFDFNLTDEDFAKLEKQDKNLRLFRSDMFKEHPEYSDTEDF